MYDLGIFTGLDLKQKKPKNFLKENFGKSGSYFYDIVREFISAQSSQTAAVKSLAAERTFSKNLSSEIFIIEKLEQIATEVSKRLKCLNIVGKNDDLKNQVQRF